MPIGHRGRRDTTANPFAGNRNYRAELVAEPTDDPPV
jgi:hypothetical protein